MCEFQLCQQLQEKTPQNCKLNCNRVFFFNSFHLFLLRGQCLANISHPWNGGISVTLASVIYKRTSQPAVLGHTPVIPDWRYLAWTMHRANCQQLEILETYVDML